MERSQENMEAGIFRHCFPSGAVPAPPASPSTTAAAAPGGTLAVKPQSGGRQPKRQRPAWTLRTPHMGPASHHQPPQANQSDQVRLLSKIVLQQADALQLLQQDRGLMMFLKQDSRSILPSMMSMAREWRQKKDQGDPALVSPLRTVLLAGLLKELLQRLQAISATAEGRESARAAGWMTEGGDWNYMKWCTKNQAPSSGCHQASTAACGGRAPAQHAVRQHERRHCLELSQHPGHPTAGGPRSHFGGVQAGDQPPGPRGDGSSQQCLRWPDRHVTAAGEAGSRTVAAATSADDIRQLRETGASPAAGPGPSSPTAVDVPRSQPMHPPAFRLLNPGNLCYLNAVAYSFWMIVRSVGPLLRLPQALRENTAGSFKARQLFAYHLLGWHRPEQQHDVAELIQYLLPKLAASSVAGGVELRQLQPAGLYRQLAGFPTHPVCSPSCHATTHR